MHKRIHVGFILTAVTVSLCWTSNAVAQCDEKADCATEPSPENGERRDDLGWTFCNRTSSFVIHVAAGYKRGDNWQSRGWIDIQRNQCEKLLGAIENRNLYYLVRLGDGYVPVADSDDDRSFCIRPHPNSFRILRKNRSACVGDGDQKWMKFEHIEAQNRTSLMLFLDSKFGDISYR